jgi:hypothetical protein
METKKTLDFKKQIFIGSDVKYRFSHGVTSKLNLDLIDDSIIIHVAHKGKHIFPVWNQMFECISYNLSDIVIIDKSIMGKTIVLTGKTASKMQNLDKRNLKTNLEHLKTNNKILNYKLVL